MLRPNETIDTLKPCIVLGTARYVQKNGKVILQIDNAWSHVAYTSFVMDAKPFRS